MTNDVPLCVRCWQVPAFYANGLCQPCNSKRQLEERREVTNLTIILDRIGQLEAAHRDRAQAYDDMKTCLLSIQNSVKLPSEYREENNRSHLSVALSLLGYLTKLERGLDTLASPQEFVTEITGEPVQEYHEGQTVYYPIDTHNYTREENGPDPWSRGLIIHKTEFLPGMFKYILRDRVSEIDVVRYGTELHETHPVE